MSAWICADCGYGVGEGLLMCPECATAEDWEAVTDRVLGEARKAVSEANDDR
jgi:hypothetical protein